MKEAYDKIDVENKELKKEKEEASNKAKEADLKMRSDRASNFVESLIKEGKIRATNEMPIEEIKKYLINKATDSYEDVVSQYSAIEGKTKFNAVKPKIATLKNGEKV